MTIHELDRLTNIIIKDFIKELFGLDYNDIILPKNVPIILSSKNMYGSGAFLLPQSNELLQNSFEEGIIVLNGKFYNTLLGNVTDSDYDIDNLIVTLIHEKIHANKVVMTNYSAFGCQDNHNLMILLYLKSIIIFYKNKMFILILFKIKKFLIKFLRC